MSTNPKTPNQHCTCRLEGYVLVSSHLFALFYKHLATFLENSVSKGRSAASRSDAQQDRCDPASRGTTCCLKRYLLFEVSFVLVLLLELLLGGLVGEHIASGKLWGLDMGET